MFDDARARHLDERRDAVGEELVAGLASGDGEVEPLVLSRDIAAVYARAGGQVRRGRSRMAGRAGRGLRPA